MEVSAFVDDLSNEPQYWEDVKSMRLISGPPGAPGAKYEGTFDVLGRHETATIEIVEHVPGERTAIESARGHVEVRVVVTYAPDGAGTRLNLAVRAKVHGMLKLFSHRIKKGMEANAAASLANLKRLLESPARGTG